MPDARVRGATQYSTHPPTLRARARLQQLPDEKRRLELARNREYNSMWQSCTRVSRRDEYRRASEPARRNMLLGNLRSIMAKRRENGKLICGVNAEAMVDRHLRKEANLRAAQEGSRDVTIALQGVSVDNRQEVVPEIPSSVDNWLESERGQDCSEPTDGASPYEYPPDLDNYMDGIDVAQRYGEQIVHLEHGMQETVRMQIHLSQLNEQTLSAISALAESSRRLDAKMEYLLQCLQRTPLPTRVAVHHPATGLTSHNVPMVAPMQPAPMQPDGYPVVNNYEQPPPQQQQQHWHQGQGADMGPA